MGITQGFVKYRPFTFHLYLKTDSYNIYQITTEFDTIFYESFFRINLIYIDSVVQSEVYDHNRKKRLVSVHCIFVQKFLRPKIAIIIFVRS